MLLAFSHQTNSVRYLGKGLYTLLSTSQQCLCSATAVSFSSYYIFLGPAGCWGCWGRNLGQNSNNNLWGFGQNYKITNMPPVRGFASSIKYPLHRTLTHTRAENSTTCVPHNTHRARPSQEPSPYHDTMIRYRVQYRTAVLYS
jgi:hypothetical protein